MTYEPHELCLAFPPMRDGEYRKLVADVREQGLLHEITLFEGKILDGRHRYQACLDAGVEPRFVDYRGTDPVKFVMAENAHRRHMTPSQIAIAATGMKAWVEREARERMVKGGAAGGASKGLATWPNPVAESIHTSEVIAERVGVGARTMTRAFAVKEKGVPELAAAVTTGAITLGEAEKIVKFAPATQKRLAGITNKTQRASELTRTTRISRAAKARESGSIGMPSQPATSFVRKVLSGLESLATVCAEAEVKNASAIASKFIDEMEWDNPALLAQYERGVLIFRALAIIQQQRGSSHVAKSA